MAGTGRPLVSGAAVASAGLQAAGVPAQALAGSWPVSPAPCPPPPTPGRLHLLPPPHLPLATVGLSALLPAGVCSLVSSCFPGSTSFLSQPQSCPACWLKLQTRTWVNRDHGGCRVGCTGALQGRCVWREGGRPGQLLEPGTLHVCKPLTGRGQDAVSPGVCPCSVCGAWKGAARPQRPGARLQPEGSGEGCQRTRISGSATACKGSVPPVGGGTARHTPLNTTVGWEGASVERQDSRRSRRTHNRPLIWHRRRRTVPPTPSPDVLGGVSVSGLPVPQARLSWAPLPVSPPSASRAGTGQAPTVAGPPCTPPAPDSPPGRRALLWTCFSTSPRKQPSSRVSRPHTLCPVPPTPKEGPCATGEGSGGLAKPGPPQLPICQAAAAQEPR